MDKQAGLRTVKTLATGIFMPCGPHGHHHPGPASQTTIPMTFLLSAMAIAACDRIMPHSAKSSSH